MEESFKEERARATLKEAEEKEALAKAKQQETKEAFQQALRKYNEAVADGTLVLEVPEVQVTILQPGSQAGDGQKGAEEGDGDAEMEGLPDDDAEELRRAQQEASEAQKRLADKKLQLEGKKRRLQSQQVLDAAASAADDAAKVRAERQEG